MHPEIDEFIATLHPKDQKSLLKRHSEQIDALRKRIPETDRVFAVIPTTLQAGGPMAVGVMATCGSGMIFVGYGGEHVISWADVHGASVVGIIGQNIYLQVGDHQVELGCQCKNDTTAKFMQSMGPAREWGAELAKQNSAAAAGPASAVSTADELAKFAALREQGVLTEEEFALKKKELLGV